MSQKYVRVVNLVSTLLEKPTMISQDMSTLRIDHCSPDMNTIELELELFNEQCDSHSLASKQTLP